ncbi:uncharacterized protein Z518_07392 [Rhinocladiella mackenziei CBS 650.93]|uniref:Inositol-pentakisphosphate 2-kinase n=1 Tax=Rhinocladiella mackenziei CBS 650.93 TaxID=1442369 RepID=A0A0D2IDD1_9EURO|nr:uncharacterized protein Z518_07392 [Rhinocladiella mackenziei CBS 650.93]KIX03839.1 hypothetical protein Z518_07392 [Rhinocladiella mackenziei CBS 650.93]
MSASHHPSAGCPSSLTSATLQLHYLAEGAANIIYSVSVLSPPSLLDHSHCCVMRLRKDLSFTKPTVKVMEDFQNRIAPLFTGHENLLMEQVLYRLTPEMVQNANAELKEMDDVDLSALSTDTVSAEGNPSGKIRHHHRRHVYLPVFEEEQHGILMQNLQGPGIDWLVEFKPKWLVQSPSAPANAKNCRTCALNAMRRQARKHQGRGDSGFCPFDLLVERSDEPGVLERALGNIWPVEEGVEKFVEVFKEKVQPALNHLVTLQKEYGSVGLEDFRNPKDKDFGVAMALRDCSVFLALQRQPGSDEGDVEVIDVKFADLDLKTTEGGKVQKWAATEQELLDGGWYDHLEGSNCSLSRQLG